MSWYRCSGCGPSIKCDVCGATQCGQNLGHNPECPEGCAAAKRLEGTPIPWNMHSPRGARPTKHNRKWLGRQRALRRKHQREGWFAPSSRWIRSRGTWIKNPHSLFDFAESLV